MKSPKYESSLSPTGRSSEIGWREIRETQQQVPHIALRVDDDCGNPLEQRFLEEHHSEAGLAGTGQENMPLGSDGQTPPDPGQAGQDPAANPALADERLLKQAERENDLLRTQMDVKDKQIERMNSQIDDLIERGREDKHLLQNFQRKLGMLAAPEQGRVHSEPLAGTELNEAPVDSSNDLPGENML